MNNKLAIVGATAALALSATAGIIDDIAASAGKAKNDYAAEQAQKAADIAAAVEKMKEEYAEKLAQKAASVSDAELLRMMRNRYAGDMAARNYEKWHGKLARQIVIDPPAGTNLAQMVKIFADGFTVTNTFHKSTPRTDAERKIYRAKVRREVLRQQIEALKKQVEEMKAGVPLAALEAKIAALENKLNNGVTVTNIVKTIGSNKGERPMTDAQSERSAVSNVTTTVTTGK